MRKVIFILVAVAFMVEIAPVNSSPRHMGLQKPNLLRWFSKRHKRKKIELKDQSKKPSDDRLPACDDVFYRVPFRKPSTQ